MFYEVKDLETFHKAMQALCEFLTSENVSPDSIFDSRLVASELLGNVLRHANGTAKLHGKVANGFVELKIVSAHAYYPTEKALCSELYAEHGRGLFLVDSICKELVFKEEDGLRVQIRIKSE